MNTVYSINGPVVKVRDTKDFSMMEMVYVGNNRLIGEVIGITDAFTTIQVYESTTSLHVGEPVYTTGFPMSVELGPGLINGIYDGIARPLPELEKLSGGAWIQPGLNITSLDREKTFACTFCVSVGDVVKGGTIFGKCPETKVIEHKLMIPSNLEGEVIWVAENGSYHVKDTVLKLKDMHGTVHELDLTQKWPIRQPRPITKRKAISRPLITGQRVIDTLFPIAKGGTAAIPGGFGTGKTMTQHQLAKWCDADMIVYIGCGERGNEMTQVLEEFSGLIDPRTNESLMQRTILIANTSNMPVAAREASIYTGITLAEYYRDMGYHIAIMADSTSRWAEALREISGRLEEMPAEEGFPAYLPSRLSEFYERAGYVETLSEQEGSVSIIGAVSPQGSDFSEPVTQNTKRFVRCFWGLDKSLAYSRHYPAINWNLSYSEYLDDLEPFYQHEVGPDFTKNRNRISGLLQNEEKLNDIVRLIGADVLQDDQKLVIEIAKVIKEGYLQQNAFVQNDTYVPLKKQFAMMDSILMLYDISFAALKKGVVLSDIIKTELFSELIRLKLELPNDDFTLLNAYNESINEKIEPLIAEKELERTELA